MKQNLYKEIQMVNSNHGKQNEKMKCSSWYEHGTGQILVTSTGRDKYLGLKWD